MPGRLMRADSTDLGGLHPRRLAFVVPGPLNQRTGGYIYDSRIVDELRAAGTEVTVYELPGRHPVPDAVARRAAAALLAELPDAMPVVIDGLALPSFEPIVAAHAARLALVFVFHHPLALERGGTDPDDAELDRAEREALRHARRIIVTSHTTAEGLVAAGVDRGRIGVVPPGCAFAPSSEAGPASLLDPQRTLRLLCVATVTARKGHLQLVEAMAGLKDLDCELDCVGSLERDPETVAAVRRALQRHALEDRVKLLPERDASELAAFYQSADVFVLPSWHEGYGMVLAEALTFGLPVVSTTAGAIPEVVPPAAGILVPPGDVDALGRALREVITDPDRRARMAAAARALRFPTWVDTARLFAAELRRAL